MNRYNSYFMLLINFEVYRTWIGKSVPVLNRKNSYFIPLINFESVPVLNRKSSYFLLLINTEVCRNCIGKVRTLPMGILLSRALDFFANFFTSLKSVFHATLCTSDFTHVSFCKSHVSFFQTTCFIFPVTSWTQVWIKISSTSSIVTFNFGIAATFSYTSIFRKFSLAPIF